MLEVWGSRFMDYGLGDSDSEDVGLEVRATG